jgi:hypothetical protein
MEESEVLVKELRELEKRLPQIERRWTEKNKALYPLALEVEASKILGPPEETKRLQEKLAAALKERDEERNVYVAEAEKIRAELRVLTSPVIQGGLKALDREMSDMPKLEETFVRRSSSGISMARNVVILTNRPGLIKVKQLFDQGKDRLRAMDLQTIAEIERFVSELIGKIRGIDLGPFEIEVDEFEFRRQRFISSPPTAQI